MNSIIPVSILLLLFAIVILRRKKTPIVRVLKYTFKNSFAQLFIIIFGLFIVGLFVWSMEKQDTLDDYWVNWLDPFIGLATFLTALLVWAAEITENWEENLPKKLTVRYIHKNKVVFWCESASLSGESDLRPWALQIGRQMTQNTQLEIEPFLDILDNPPIKNEQKEYIKPYFVTIYLSDKNNKLFMNGPDNVKTGKSQYLLWRPNLKKDKFKGHMWCAHPVDIPDFNHEHKPA